MVAEPRNGAARRSRFVPLCAITALLLAAAACLNPVPDDFPNERDNLDDVDVSPGGNPADPGENSGGGADLGGDEDDDSPQTPPAPATGDPDLPPDAGDAGVLADRRSDAGQEAPDAGLPTEAGP